MAKIRFGIIGCSNIAKSSTIPAIINSQNSELKNIGSRNIEKAQDFANEFNCKKFGNYEDVLNDDDIDAVYISTPIGTHEEWVKKSAFAGKHILCEKSSTTSFSSAQKIVDICKENKVRLMEGFMFRFHPSHKKVKEFLVNKTLGKIFSFYSRYGFPPIPKNNIRYDHSLGGGILNDAGCYPICASRILFDSEPESVYCNLSIDKSFKVDTKASIGLKFPNGIFSQSQVGYDLSYQSVYSIWGSEGSLQLSRAYNVPSNMHVDLILESNTRNEKIEINPINHFELMINHFSNELINPGNSSFDFERDLIYQAQVMDAARLSNKEQRLVRLDEIK